MLFHNKLRFLHPLDQVHDLSPQWLSRNISVVSQEPTLFARSIRRNIMYGLEGTEFEPTDAEIREAARLANAASFIEVSDSEYWETTCFSCRCSSYTGYLFRNYRLDMSKRSESGECS
jgi:hypothetical protein